MSDSLQVTDQAAAAVAKAPRVSLVDIEAAIGEIHYANARDVAELDGSRASEHLATLTVCLVTMRNGFTVIGKSAPASPENFDAALGRKFAYEDAVRQLWPLMGFALRDKLAGGSVGF